ncbi:MAG: hypothetical protein ACQEQV_07955 [Fibrobacterota bacterium]
MQNQGFSEETALKINILFNNLVLFGAGHPSIHSAAQELSRKLSEAPDGEKNVTLIKNGDSFYIRKVCVDANLNRSRTSQHFTKTGIESITFETTASADDIQGFGHSYITAVQEQHTADDISKELEKKDITSIHVNFVTLEEVTRNETVVGEGPASGESPDPELNKKIYRGVQNVISGGVGEQDNSAPLETEQIEQQFSLFEQQLSDSSGDDRPDYDAIFSSLLDISENLRRQNTIENRLDSLDESDDLITECENLTIDTIVKIIKEEYDAGERNPARIALLIKRITRDPGEIKQLFPRLKKRMLAEGMSYSFFIDITSALEDELSRDTSMDKLFSRAEQFGIERSELVNAISENPGESARLLVQAAELARADSSTDVSEYLAGMVEDVSQKMLYRSETAQENSPLQKTALSDIVKTLEDKLMQVMGEQFSDESVLKEVQEKLQRRYPETVKKIKAEWVVDTLGHLDSYSPEALSDVIYRAADSVQEIEEYKETLSLYEDKFGLSPDEISTVLSQVRKKKEQARNRSSINILPPRITTYFLKRYVEEFVRYGHPFSIIAVSGGSVEPSLTEWLAKQLGETLRFLDLIGYVTIKQKEISLLILPMTDSRNLNTAMQRIGRDIGERAEAVSTQSVDRENRVDNYETLMKRLLKVHFE